MERYRCIQSGPDCLSEDEAVDYLWGQGDYSPRLKGAHCADCHRNVAHADWHDEENHSDHEPDCEWVLTKAHTQDSITS